MCVIIYKPVGESVSDETLKYCSKSNRDGFGYSYIGYRGEKKYLRVYKGLSFDNFLTAYKKAFAKYGDTSPFLIHFRMRTHGDISVENCHPFFVKTNYEDNGVVPVVMAHNGYLSCVKPTGNNSDTAEFVADVLSNIDHPIVGNDSIGALIGDYVGTNKLVFMDIEGNVSFVNEDKGVWDNGVWYSNTGYKPYESPYRSQNYSDFYSRGYYSSNQYDYERTVEKAEEKKDVCAKDFCLMCGAILSGKSEKVSGFCNDCVCFDKESVLGIDNETKVLCGSCSTITELNKCYELVSPKKDVSVRFICHECIIDSTLILEDEVLLEVL